MNCAGLWLDDLEIKENKLVSTASLLHHFKEKNIKKAGLKNLAFLTMVPLT